MMERKNIGLEMAGIKIRQYCAYQERCHSEVKEKLFYFGLNEEESGEVISQLISEDLLNEERFARAYAGGKFRMKGWGRLKIKAALKQKRVSDYCIKKGLEEIDEEEYSRLFEKLFNEKSSSLRSEKNKWKKMAAIRSFLLQRGFEHALISEALSE
jgi:regulatory protein